MSNILRETVLDVQHHTDKLFSFKASRDSGFRFRTGEFAMIGLEVDGRPLMRAYSMVSGHYEDHLEFLSIKVPNGALTSRLQNIKPGDKILVNRKTTGTLVVDNLLPGKRLWLISTGTGIAPFLSMIKDPEVYEQFDQIILTHTVRNKAELVYQDLIASLPDHEILGEIVGDKLIYFPTVTREEFQNQGRITDYLRTGKINEVLGLPPLSVEDDRVMVCGNPNMMKELSDYLKSQGFVMGNHGEPGHFVIEKAFAEK